MAVAGDGKRRVAQIRRAPTSKQGNNAARPRSTMKWSSGKAHPYYFGRLCSRNAPFDEIVWISRKQSARRRLSSMTRMFCMPQSMVETTEKAPEGAFSIEAYCVCEAQMRTALARIVLYPSAGRHIGRRTSAGGFTPWYAARYRNRNRQRRPRRALRQRKRRSR